MVVNHWMKKIKSKFGVEEENPNTNTAPTTPVAPTPTPTQTPPPSSGNSVGGAIFTFLIFAGVIAGVYFFLTRCRVVGQRMGAGGRMESIYDCSTPAAMMYAAPQPMMYAASQPMMYAASQPMMYAAPPPATMVARFGRRR